MSVAPGAVRDDPERGLHVNDQQPPAPVNVRRHMRNAISLKGMRSDVKRADGLNAKLAVFLTNMVGSMWCAYAFAGLAFIGLPAALKPGGEGIIAWIAQTFLQLVLLSVIMVGQNVQSVASDARAQRTYDDTITILDRLDVHTAGGIKELADRLDAIAAALRTSAGPDAAPA